MNAAKSIRGVCKLMNEMEIHFYTIQDIKELAAIFMTRKALSRMHAAIAFCPGSGIEWYEFMAYRWEVK